MKFSTAARVSQPLNVNGSRSSQLLGEKLLLARSFQNSSLRRGSTPAVEKVSAWAICMCLRDSVCKLVNGTPLIDNFGRRLPSGTSPGGSGIVICCNFMHCKSALEGCVNNDEAGSDDRSKIDAGPLMGYLGYALRRAQLTAYADFIAALGEVAI